MREMRDATGLSGWSGNFRWSRLYGLFGSFGLSDSFGPMHTINETDQINEIDQIRPACLARPASKKPCAQWVERACYSDRYRCTLRREKTPEPFFVSSMTDVLN